MVCLDYTLRDVQIWLRKHLSCKAPTLCTTIEDSSKIRLDGEDPRGDFRLLNRHGTCDLQTHYSVTGALNHSFLDQRRC